MCYRESHYFLQIFNTAWIAAGHMDSSLARLPPASNILEFILCFTSETGRHRHPSSVARQNIIISEKFKNS